MTTDERLTDLIEALWNYHRPDAHPTAYGKLYRRLAALRAPGVGRERVNEIDRYIDTLKSALATARRERDEAVAICRRLVDGSGETLEGIIRDARALVARGAGPSKLDAIMTEREAEIIGESFAAERELRAEIATIRASLAERDATIETCRETISRQRAMIAEAQGEVARLTREVEDLRRHAHGWRMSCEAQDVLDSALGISPVYAEPAKRVEVLVADRDALRTRLDAAGRLIERAGAFAYQVVDFINGAPISLSLQQSRALLADLRAWGK